MSIFSKKIPPQVAKQMNSLISKIKTCAENMDLADTPKKFFSAYDKMEEYLHILTVFDKQGYRTNPPVNKFYSDYNRLKRENENSFLKRAQVRMYREANELKTDKAKYNRALKFYEELEFYYPQMVPENISFVQQLKSQDIFLRSYNSSTTKSGQQCNFCPMCGAKRINDTKYCSECGFKF